MKIYTGTTWNKRQQDESIQYGLGWITTPQDPISPNKIPEEIPYILDNGAFRAWKNGTEWNEQEFYETLHSLNREPDFVVIPDIVAAGMTSYLHSMKHLAKIPFKKYLAVQDGMQGYDVIQGISLCDGVFVGGTLIWKWRTAREWVQLAHSLGKKCHIGRVGTIRGYDKAHQIGADSVDGTGPVRHDKLWIIQEWRQMRQKQQRLLAKEEWMLKVEEASSK